ncbi:hypothetical protein [Enterobacter sp.]|uniref:hypothetical protein n=1 Tax=Enterobacter sp. TaxID=42895 RepID=UPI00296EBA42|nr:hypothetical protein [Enterobacter sp.]
MRTKINKADLTFIIKIISNSPLAERFKAIEKNGEYLEKNKHPTGKYIIELSDPEVDFILDRLSAYIMELGVDANGEINSIGIYVDSLIDLFN